MWGIAPQSFLKINANFCEMETNKIIKGVDAKIDLVTGLCRPPSLKKILEHGTCCGVKRFHFVHCELGEKSFLDSKMLKPDNYNEQILLGLSQSHCYYQFPEVIIYRSFHEFLQNISKLPATRFCLEKNAESGLENPLNNDVTIAVGPERGFTDNEIQFLNQNSFKNAVVSKTTLRVEYAVLYALAQLEFLTF